MIVQFQFNNLSPILPQIENKRTKNTHKQTLHWFNKNLRDIKLQQKADVFGLLQEIFHQILSSENYFNSKKVTIVSVFQC